MSRQDMKCRRCDAVAQTTPTGWDLSNHTDACREVVILEPLSGPSEGACSECSAPGGHYTHCSELTHDARWDDMSPEMRAKFALAEVPAA